ncbi:3-hydroxyacyl-CoA dehydrogenase NAD-binding domain-containing protein [Tsukamurella sp. 8F]|uniref:3-hydroxyacyl-CoA dehydrogenase NAD-binding domain-containing protein n=1 Tax=unclassified Tsukamurella TaxID=2633480 RepID=UPI0023B9C70E|nr:MULTISPECIES: 3-hydroxyacyl-CoA dehydrogenase NAD-binding domain-containing protein [unclassified Tsukamurella]MDF0530368.1 3-hydroxyacyl-CoA dehydrogenase NAD-binding domain-containing protein [Tsukamurella sp. 8J]MDF0587665.1 3-hydroxyacyl-CoA dehydrogenase NAD-binding domain-containing protein [Tsukamurella sp. 8F]
MAVVTVIGAGVIGVSWARLFADAGWEVRVSDPRPDLDEVLEGTAATAVPDLAEALRGADFVQENGPERVEVKRELFATAAQHTADGVVLASSSSTLLPSVFAADNPAADRIVVGHPFNPPELMPLVEVVPSPSTAASTVDRAVEVYRQLGKLPIRLNKEIAGFVGNRLQRVFNEQATYLVQQGVIDPAELDVLVRASLGLRWSTIGPFESRHLGGGPGGIRHLAAHVGAAMTFDVGAPDPARNDEVYAAVEAAYGTGEEAYQRLVDQRDRRTRAVLEALARTDHPDGTADTEAVR